MAFHIALHSNDSDIVRDYPEGIDLQKGYEVALKSFVAYNNIPNIGPRLGNCYLKFINLLRVACCILQEWGHGEGIPAALIFGLFYIFLV